ncbi:MAG: sensor histidine kinase, partial [Spirochaetota bacterium]
AEHGGDTVDEQYWRVLRSDGTRMPVEEFPGVRALEVGRQVDNIEMGIVKSPNDVLWLNVTAAPIPLERYGVAVAYTDISDRKNAEEELKRALEERTVLIQELSHRTKNNMQVVSALLDWRTHGETDERIVSILRNTRNRIRSMALVHEHLYQSRSLSHVNLEPYVRELADTLTESFQVSPQDVRLRWSTKSVWTLIDSAIPFGLIVAEVLSNALEHAFADGRTGEIEVFLARVESGEVLLRITDNGVGLPAGFDPKVDGGLGLQTVFALGEDQLQGRVELEDAEGVSCTVEFRDDLYGERV